MTPDFLKVGHYYGYYTGQPPEKLRRGDESRFLNLYDRPFENADGAFDFLKASADVLPVFRPVLAGVFKDDTLIQIVQQNRISTGSGPDGVRVLRFPQGCAPRDFFPDLLKAASYVAELPDGLVRFPHSWGQDAAKIAQSLCDRHFFDLAVGMTFLFQAAVEIDALGLPVTPQDPMGFLTEEDLHLFRSFRRAGLRGMAEVYFKIEREAVRADLLATFASMAQSLAEGTHTHQNLHDPDYNGGSIPSDDPSIGVPETFLDQLIKERTYYDGGLYSHSPVTPPNDSLIAETLTLLKKNIGRDVDALIKDTRRLLKIMAPSLGERLESVLNEAHPLLSRVSLFGNSYQHALPTLLSYLASQLFPQDARGRDRVFWNQPPTEIRRTIASVTYKNDISPIAFGWTGVFEFMRESKARGFNLRMPDPIEKAFELFKNCEGNWELLGERFDEFASGPCSDIWEDAVSQATLMTPLGLEKLDRVLFPGAKRQGYPSYGRFTSIPDPQNPGVVLIDAPTGGSIQGVTLYFHSNGDILADLRPIAIPLKGQSQMVVLPEYPGFGGAPGAATQTSLYQNAVMAYDAIMNSLGDNFPLPVTVMGWSLGAAVAAYVAAERHVDHLVLLAPMTSMREVVLGQYPQFLSSPDGDFLRGNEFDVRRYVYRIRARTTILHGVNDPLVPIHMGREIANSLGDRARFIEIPDAGHQITPALDTYASQLFSP